MSKLEDSNDSSRLGKVLVGSAVVGGAVLIAAYIYHDQFCDVAQGHSYGKYIKERLARDPRAIETLTQSAQQTGDQMMYLTLARRHEENKDYDKAFDAYIDSILCLLKYLKDHHSVDGKAPVAIDGCEYYDGLTKCCEKMKGAPNLNDRLQTSGLRYYPEFGCFETLPK